MAIILLMEEMIKKFTFITPAIGLSCPRAHLQKLQTI